MRGFAALALAALWAGCSGAPDVGGACTLDADCPSGAGCFGVGASGLRLCLVPCEPLETVSCTEAEQGAEGVCVELEGGGACYTGGVSGEGETCELTVDCELGLLCVLGPGGEGSCREACDPGAPSCRGDETCESLGGPRGYCAP